MKDPKTSHKLLAFCSPGMADRCPKALGAGRDISSKDTGAMPDLPCKVDILRMPEQADGPLEVGVSSKKALESKPSGAESIPSGGMSGG